MIKLITKDSSGVVVEKVGATCDWCGEHGSCIRSPRGIAHTQYQISRELVICGEPRYKLPLFGRSYWRVGSFDRKDVILGKDEVVTRDLDICKDCAKQIAELLK